MTDKSKDDRYFMKKALEQADAALAEKEFPVGCVIVSEDRIWSSGLRKGSSGRRPGEIDHAEIVALQNLEGEEGAPKTGLCLYVTMEPCLMCYGALLIRGITRIVYAYEDVMGGATGIDPNGMGPLYRNRHPEIVPYVMREESLDRFHRFFSDPMNKYWGGSLLAEYTLRQSQTG